MPEEGTLKPGTLYEGTFQLGDFIEVDKKLKEFNFSFRVQERNFTLQLESLPITLPGISSTSDKYPEKLMITH